MSKDFVLFLWGLYWLFACVLWCFVGITMVGMFYEAIGSIKPRFVSSLLGAFNFYFYPIFFVAAYHLTFKFNRRLYFRGLGCLVIICIILVVYPFDGLFTGIGLLLYFGISTILLTILGIVLLPRTRIVS